MMSDNASPTCKQGDGNGNGIVNGTKISASQTPYMGQWMAHWLQACRSSSSKTCQLHSAALTGNTLHQSEGHHSKALDRVNSKEFKEFKFVRVDMSRSYSFGAKGKSNFADEDDPLSYSLRSGETSEVNKGKFKVVEKSSMRRNVEAINDETTFSEKVSTQQLTESSIKWKKSGSSSCCQSRDISESDFEHFPMLEINRKIESLLASKKKSAYGAVSVKIVTENLSLCESTGTTSLVELAPGSCLAAKHYEGFLHDNAEDMDRASSPVSHGCKYQKTNMVACMFSYGLTDLDPMNNNRCSCCSSSKSMTTGIKRKTSSISKGLGNSWTSLKGGSTHLLKEPSPADFPYFSPEIHISEVKGDSSMPNCSKHDMSLPESCQLLKSVDIGERFQKFSSTVKYLLVADKVEKYQCLREQTKGDTKFTQVNASTSSTLPTKQNYGKKEKSTVPMENFVSDEDMNDCDDNGAHLMVEHNEFLTKTDTVYSHPIHRSSSLPGESFSMSQKGITSSNLRNPIPVFASSRDVSITKVETGMAEKREADHPASTQKATDASHKEASVSSTESLAADHHIALQVRASDVSSSSTPLPNHTSGSETCSKWIERLQDNHSETAPCTKRFKRGDDSSNEIQQTPTIQNYNPLRYASHRSMNEQEKCVKSMTSLENVLHTGDSDESVQLWMRRWHRSGNEASSTASILSVPLTLLPEKSRAALEKFEEKMSVSIGGMALMGKAMKNYRPHRFRREEGSLVWNTEE